MRIERRGTPSRFQRPAGHLADPAEILLLQEIAGGKEAGGKALAELYDRTARSILSLVVRILGDLAEAEEVLQEVFLKVWREAGRFDPARSSVRGWLLMMARSRALDRLRNTQVRRRAQAAVRSAGVPTAVVPPGLARLEHRERRGRVASALGALPREQREALELAFFEGLTHTQIAELLDAPLGTVKSRILLGMRKLRLLLAELSQGQQAVGRAA